MTGNCRIMTSTGQGKEIYGNIYPASVRAVNKAPDVLYRAVFGWRMRKVRNPGVFRTFTA